MSKQVAAQLMMGEVEEFRKRRAEIEKTAQAAYAQLGKEVEDFKKGVLCGKVTTGDAITDYFLAAGYFEEEPAKPFRDVAARLKGKKDQLVLVVQRERERHVFGGPGHSSESDYHLETRRTLGILSDDALVLDLKKQSYGLPTESFVELNDHRPMEKRSGPFIFDMFCGFDKLGKTISGGHDSGPELELVIGCDEVFNYSPYPYAGRMQSPPASWICERNKAIRFLGRNIPEAPEEKAAREREQKEVLALLDATRDKRKKLEKYKASRAELQECDESLRHVFDHAKALNLKDHALVVLIASENGW